MSIKKIQFSPIKERTVVQRINQISGNDEEDEEKDDIEFIANCDLTVKFEITDTQTIAHSYKRSLSLKDIKRDIAGKFRVADNLLELLLHDTGLVIEDEGMRLNDLPRNKFGIVELLLRVNAKENGGTKLDLSVYYSNFTLPEIITVNIAGNTGGEDDNEDGQEDRKIFVEIDNRQIVKPFLGGFRDPATKIEYHNASTQTGPMKVYRNAILTRETQTEAYLVKSLRTTRTPRNEIREFVSSDAMVCRLEKLKCVKVIQRTYRAYKWRKLVRESAEQWRIVQQKAREKMNYETSGNGNYNRVLRLLYMEPKEKEDFDRIYAAIQHWKTEEKTRLKALHTQASYIAELSLVVDKEIFLLNEVDQRRHALKRAFKEKSSERLLDRLGRPKKFVARDKSILEIDTLLSQKIRFWTAYYNSLKSPPTDKRSRLTLLDNVMESLNGERESLGVIKLKDLRELIDRERNLWEMNFSSSDMDTLRDRQLLLLFNFIETIGVDNNRDSVLGTQVKRICGKCKNLLPESRFVLLGRKDISDICKRCDALHRPNKDENVYREILRSIRRDERKCGALASFAFIIQEQDIQYIVETIWHGHSILSQTTERHRLRLPRFSRSEDWAPWNCICLTETEAKAHLKLRNLTAVYQEHLLKLIASRNNLALTAFRRLQSVNYEFVESGQWWSSPPQSPK